MNRKDLRDLAVKMFYEMDIHKSFDEESVHRLIENYSADVKDDYLIRLSLFFVNNKQIIDDTIQKNSVSWALNRIAKTDLSILRVSFTEILYMEDIPSKVTINEAIELAKVYGDEKAYKFVNGVLGNLMKNDLSSGEE